MAIHVGEEIMGRMPLELVLNDKITVSREEHFELADGLHTLSVDCARLTERFQLNDKTSVSREELLELADGLHTLTVDCGRLTERLQKWSDRLINSKEVKSST